MPIIQYRPVTKGRRLSSVQDFSDITVSKPSKRLRMFQKEMGGRNNQGKLTVRHRGGGNKTFIRVVDFRREKYDIPAVVKTVEYDPHRGARISLVAYKDGEKRYILTPDGVRPDQVVVSSQTSAEIAPGNRLPLEKIPVGMSVHAVELVPGKGGQLGRGAGNSIEFLAVEGRFATLRLPSGEMRMVPKECMATIGTVSNPDYHLVRYGKAGRMRYRGIRPTVRGKVMNPVDHPHGGGEGKHPIGMKYPKTKWGKHALGVKTRRSQVSDKLIVKRRKSSNA